MCWCILYILVTTQQKNQQKESVATQLENAVEGAWLEEDGMGEECVPLADIPGQ